jgi:outer membrane receptor for ferrienterochelin and colicin
LPLLGQPRLLGSHFRYRREFRIPIPPKAALATVFHLVLLFGFKTVAQAQTADANPAPVEDPTGGTATGGNQLQQFVVTGSLIPRIGQGPQRVTTYDQHYIQDTGYQTVTDVLQNLLGATGNFNPAVTSGFSFSPASASIALKGLLPNDTLVLVDGVFLSFPSDCHRRCF